MPASNSKFHASWVFRRSSLRDQNPNSYFGMDKIMRKKIEFQQGRFSNDETSNNADYVSQCYISTLISAYVGQSINTRL